MASILAYFHDRQDVTKDRVAIVIMSGGKDSRIGGQIPKGALDVGLLSHKSIFQLYIERIRRLQHLVQRKFKKAVYIPVYIMCNRDNKEIIEDFFRENEFFGIESRMSCFSHRATIQSATSAGNTCSKRNTRSPLTRMETVAFLEPWWRRAWSLT